MNSGTGNASVGDGAALPPALQGLVRAQAYPHPVPEVMVITTHLSWILIAGAYAYKIKRPVCYPFVDQRRLDERQRLCAEELRLNRRFSPQLYLAVCPITAADGQACIGGEGVAIEYAVQMRAFDREQELSQLVLRQEVETRELRRFGCELAKLQQRLPIPEPGSEAGAPTKVLAALRRNADECADASRCLAGEERVAAVARWLVATTSARQAALQERVRAGRIRECHADLHASNIVRIAGSLVPFDCLEFEPAFRWIDVARDLAFLHADLLGYGEPPLAAALLDAWLAESGDYQACQVLNLYIADRALVRAKVMALLAAQERSPTRRELRRQRFDRYLSVAERSAQPQNPWCVMMHGLPGSGKSWLAACLVTELSAIAVRSDLERKRLAGMSAANRSHSAAAAGLYSAARTAAVYRRLERCAADVLGSGRTVIVDANYGQREQRSALAAPCKRLAAPLLVIHCEAPLALLQQRIVGRMTAGTDPSEADLTALDHQRGQQESIVPEERLDVIRVRTDRPEVRQQLLRELSARRVAIAPQATSRA